MIDNIRGLAQCKLFVVSTFPHVSQQRVYVSYSYLSSESEEAVPPIIHENNAGFVPRAPPFLRDGGDRAAVASDEKTNLKSSNRNSMTRRSPGAAATNWCQVSALHEFGSVAYLNATVCITFIHYVSISIFSCTVIDSARDFVIVQQCDKPSFKYALLVFR